MQIFSLSALLKLEGGDKFNKDIDEATKKGDTFGSKLSSAMGKASAAVLKVASAATTAAGAFAVKYLKDGMKAAEDYALSYTKLETVMRNTMDASDDQIQSMVRLAEAQQQLGVVSQAAQITALAELASFVERKESMEDMLPVMNDYIAYQYGIGASEEQSRNVATALGKAIQGNIDGLSKQGFVLDEGRKEWFKTATEMERVQYVMELVGESMGGVNEALAQTDAGRLFQLEAAASSAQQQIGELANKAKIELMGEFLPAITSISQAFYDMITGDGSPERVTETIGDMVDKVISLVTKAVPQMLEIGSKVLLSFVRGIANAVPELTKAAVGILPEVVDTIIDMLPDILDAGVKTILELTNGIAKTLPELVPKAIDAVLTLAEGIVDNLEDIIDAGVQLLKALGQGIINALPIIEEKAPIIIDKFVTELGKAMNAFGEYFYNIGYSMGQKIQEGIMGLLSKLPGPIKEFFGIVEQESVKTGRGAGKAFQEISEDVDTRMRGAGRSVAAIYGGIRSEAAETSKKNMQYSKEMAASYDWMAQEAMMATDNLFQDEREKLDLSIKDTDKANKDKAKGASDAAKAKEKAAKDAFAKEKTLIEDLRIFEQIELEDAIAMYEELQRTKVEGSEEHYELEKTLHTLRKQLDAERLESSKKIAEQEKKDAEEEKKRIKEQEDAIAKLFASDKKYIDDKKFYNLLSTQEEVALWEDTQSKYLEGTKEREDADRSLYEAKKRLITEQETLLDKITAAEKKYSDAVDARAQTIYQSFGMFDELKEREKVVGKDLTKNLQDQVKELQNWSSNLEKLAKKGIDEGLLAELEKMGPGANAEIEALSKMSASELTKYAALWQQKHELARTQAAKELEGLREDTDEQIRALYDDLDAIIGENSYVLGENLVEGIIEGFNDRISELTQSIAQAMAGVFGDLPNAPGGGDFNLTIENLNTTSGDETLSAMEEFYFYFRQYQMGVGLT